MYSTRKTESVTDEKFLDLELSEAEAEEIKEEIIHSYAVAKRLLPFLAKRGIPASPSNYRIFYDYLLYSNPALNKAVNALLESNAKFHSRLSVSLYELFYSNESLDDQLKALNKAATDFMTVSSSMEQSLENVINQTNHYQKVLSNTSRQVAGLTSADQLQPFLDDLMNETEMALASNGSFSSQINEANRTITALKAELKNQTSLAKVDELTQLHNRRHLNLEWPRLVEECGKKGEVISAVMFDLDFFKRINDTWGHNFGDKVLVVCAKIIKGAAREGDLAIRLGGEEFLLVCPGLNLSQASKVAEKVRISIAQTDITIRGESLMLTISGGAAQYIEGETLSDLIGRADQALYQAKSQGRNMICLACN